MSELQHKHGILLDDTIRMRAYERAIQALVEPGDIVADLGCGLGVLSFFAARAGASRVHAVEFDATTLTLARQEAERVGLGDRIHFHEGLAQTVDVPERVDVIITETLGSLGLDENILPLIIDARTNWLKPRGRMCPQAVTLTLAPVAHKTDDPSPNHRPEIIDPKTFAALPVTSQRCNFVNAQNHNFVVELQFAITQDTIITGFAGWFQVWLTEKIHFATGPREKPTHWQQAFLPIREPLALTAGQSIDFTLGIGPDESSLQSIVEFDFTIT